MVQWGSTKYDGAGDACDIPAPHAQEVIAPMRTIDHTTRDRFASHFDPTTEIPLVNHIFLRAIRGGASTIDGVYTRVEIALREDLRDAALRRDKERHAKIENIIYYFEHFPEEACDYARYYLAWERLTPEQKRAARAAQDNPGRDARMATQPASEKQIAYARSLGYTGEITSKLHASQIIDGLTKRGAA